MLLAALNIFTVEELIRVMGTKYGNAAVRKVMSQQGKSEDEITKMCTPVVTELKHVSIFHCAAIGYAIPRYRGI